MDIRRFFVGVEPEPPPMADDAFSESSSQSGGAPSQPELDALADDADMLSLATKEITELKAKLKHKTEVNELQEQSGELKDVVIAKLKVKVAEMEAGHNVVGLACPAASEPEDEGPTVVAAELVSATSSFAAWVDINRPTAQDLIMISRECIELKKSLRPSALIAVGSNVSWLSTRQYHNRGRRFGVVQKLHRVNAIVEDNDNTDSTGLYRGPVNTTWRIPIVNLRLE